MGDNKKMKQKNVKHKPPVYLPNTCATIMNILIYTQKNHPIFKKGKTKKYLKI